jgi:hypothetical protein
LLSQARLQASSGQENLMCESVGINSPKIVLPAVSIKMTTDIAQELDTEWSEHDKEFMREALREV